MNEHGYDIDESLRRWAEEVRASETAAPDYDLSGDAARQPRPRRWIVPVLAAAAVAVIAGSITAIVGTSAHSHAPANTRQAATSQAATSGDDCPATRAYRAGVGGIVDYVNFVQLNRQTYVSGSEGTPVSAKAKALLGTQIAHVTCTLVRLQHGGQDHIVGPYLNGNAAFLPVGTPIYHIDGYPSTCRIAAIWNGRIYQYLAQANSSGRAKPRACASKPAH